MAVCVACHINNPPKDETHITVIDHEVNIIPHFATHYEGTTILKFRAERPMRSINLIFSPSITIKSSSLTAEKEKITYVADSYYNSKDYSMQLFVHKKKKTYQILKKNFQYTFTVNFVGMFEHNKKGFFVTTYTDNTVEKHYAVAGWTEKIPRTESTKPFYFFPYFNVQGEEEIKLTVQKPDGYMAIASAGLLDTPENPQKRAISPFLFSLFIGQFQSVSNTNGTIELTAYLPHETEPAPSQSIVVLDIGSKIIEHLGKILNSTEDLKKIAYIILPDSPSNLRDSWNLVYYHGGDNVLGVPLKEILIIPTEQINGSHISPTVIHKALLIVAKKNIIQFMRFRPLLLKETTSNTSYAIKSGLANFLKYEMIIRVMPQYDSREMIYLDYIQPFLWQNFVSFKDNNEVMNKSDRFTAVIHMFSDFLRVKPLFYDEFLTDLHKVSNNLNNIEKTFIHYFVGVIIPQDTKLDTKNCDNILEVNGYPVLRVNYKKMNINQTIVTVDQVDLYTETPTKFYIPFALWVGYERGSKNNAHRSQHMVTTKKEIILNDPLEFYYLNDNRSVTYRVNYPDTMWGDLAKSLEARIFSRIPPISRAKLIDDIMVLTLRGWHRDLTLLFNMFNYLSKETELLPWNVAARHLKYMYLKFRRASIKDDIDLEEMIREKVTPILSSLGFKDRGNSDSLSQKILRGIIIELACMAKVPKCIREVHKIIKPIKNPYRELDVNLRDAICCAALRQNESSDFLNLVTSLEQNYNDQIPDERLFYIRCLSCCPSEKCLIEYIKKTDPSQGEFKLTAKEIQVAQQCALENVDSQGVLQFELYLFDAESFKKPEKAGTKGIVKGWLTILATHARSNDSLASLNNLVDTFIEMGYLDASEKAQKAAVATNSIKIYQKFRGYLSPKKHLHITK